MKASMMNVVESRSTIEARYAANALAGTNRGHAVLAMKVMMKATSVSTAIARMETAGDQ